jgi:hypothetical protein
MALGSSSSSLSSSSVSISSSESVADVVPGPCDDGKRRVQLQPLFQKNFVSNADHGFRLRVDVTQVCFMETHLFRYYRYPPDLLTGAQIDEFSGVCSWPDLLEFPEEDPNPTASPQVFRLPYFDAVLRSENLANEAWAIIQEEVAELVNTVDAGETLEATGTVWLGAELST